MKFYYFGPSCCAPVEEVDVLLFFYSYKSVGYSIVGVDAVIVPDAF